MHTGDLDTSCNGVSAAELVNVVKFMHGHFNLPWYYTDSTNNQHLIFQYWSNCLQSQIH